MAPNYIDFPERRAELRAEVETLLEADGSRAGAVYRTSLNDVQAQRGTKTQAGNEVDYILPGLLQGRIPAAVEPRKKVASRLRSWLSKNEKPLSPELRADLETQLEAIEALEVPIAPATTSGSESGEPTPNSGWDQFMYWAEKIVSQPKFRSDERDYKVEAAQPLRESVTQLRARGDWAGPLERAFRVQKGNLVDWHVTGGRGSFGEWAATEPDACGAALAALWTDHNSHGGERIAAFDALVPAEVIGRPGGLANLGAYLLGGLDEARWPNFRIGVLELAWELTRFPPPANSTASGNYEHALIFFDAMRAEAAERGFVIVDRLDAQGIMWVIASGGDRGPYDFSEAEWAELEAFTGVSKAPRPPEADQTAPDERRFEVPEDTDRLVITRARKEQGRLRDYLLDKRTEAPCDLCGRLLPKDFLVAAHIAPRHALDHEERMQFDRIAMIACLLGCDQLFELGYLNVDEHGMICARNVEGELSRILEGLAGRRCTAHSKSTAAAFAVHRTAGLQLE